MSPYRSHVRFIPAFAGNTLCLIQPDLPGAFAGNTPIY